MGNILIASIVISCLPFLLPWQKSKVTFPSVPQSLRHRPTLPSCSRLPEAALNCSYPRLLSATETIPCASWWVRQSNLMHKSLISNIAFAVLRPVTKLRIDTTPPISFTHLCGCQIQSCLNFCWIVWRFFEPDRNVSIKFTHLGWDACTTYKLYALLLFPV